MANPLVGWGISKDFIIRKAVHQALQQALTQIGQVQPSVAIFLTSREFQAEALDEAKNILGNIPLWGFTTAAPIDEKGEHPGAILAIVLSGRDVAARVGWWEQAHLDSTELCGGVQKFLRAGKNTSGILVAGDGDHAHPDILYTEFASHSFTIGGALSSRSMEIPKTLQIGNGFSSEGALSILELSGDISLALGMGAGWQDIGLSYMVTGAQGHLLTSLDDQPPAEIFTQLFGKSINDWRNPPLSEMIRMYPLGIELFPGSTEIVLRSPMRVQPDGSFMMNAPVVEGQMAHLMVGNIESCLDAAQSAARQALQAVGKAKPFFSLVLVDVAWRNLFHGEIFHVSRAVEHVLGQVPIVGGYTSGQLFRTSNTSPLQIYNQNILVILFCHPLSR
jgi:hypothetical protein